MSFERENIHRMSGYVSGEQPDDPQTIKLNTNENPYPPTPAVDDVLAGFSRTRLRRYPPPTAIAFREAAARLHGLQPENVIATRGGDELLRLLITTFVDPGQPIGMTDPSYSLYPVLAQIQDCPVVTQPMTPDWQPADDFADRMNAAGVRLTFIVNPHAPSGALMPVGRVDELARDLNSILVLDEAYIDFVDHDYATTPLVREHDNLVILRTLSKGYSLAGLRFGYGLGPASLIEPMLTKTRDSYNLDAISQEVALAALADQAHAKNTWQAVIRDREKLAADLRELGLDSPPSQANFLLVSVPGGLPYKAPEIYQKLKELHILVRYFDLPGLQDRLRISLGTPDENRRLMNAMRSLLD